MDKTNEETVTRILSLSEILYVQNNLLCESDSPFNLGNFLKKKNDEPNPYGEKYLFVR